MPNSPDRSRRFLTVSLVALYVLTLMGADVFFELTQEAILGISAVFMTALAIRVEVYAGRWRSVQQKLDSVRRQHLLEVRPLQLKAVQLERTLLKTRQQLEMCSEYRLLLLSLLTNRYPSGLRLEYYVTEEHEFAWFLYIDLPPELPLRQHQLRFRLSEHEELMLRHLKPYENPCTVSSDAEVEQTLSEYIALAGFPLANEVPVK